MSDPSAQPASDLAADDVRRLARLARLDPTETQIAEWRGQLAAVLDHIGRINELALDDVEPLAHPLDMPARLAPDEPIPGFEAATILANAPASEGDYLIAPRVLDQD